MFAISLAPRTGSAISACLDYTISKRSLVPLTQCFMPRRGTGSSKFNLRHPRSPHTLKAKMLAAMKPLYAPDIRTPAEVCRKAKLASMIPVQDLPPHPYETVLAREARRVLDGSNLIVLCHSNPVGPTELRTFRNAVWKLNLRMWPTLNNRILKFAVEGGRLACLTPFLHGKTMIITSPDLNFADMNRGLKRLTSLVPLMAVANHEYVLSVPQLEAFGRKYKTGITQAHGELVSVLSNPARTLIQALQHEAMTLSACLDFVAKQPPAVAADPAPVDGASPAANV